MDHPVYLCQVREQKEELVRMVRSLGGSVVERDEWDPRVTHVIARVGREGKETMSEKVVARHSLHEDHADGGAGDGGPGGGAVGGHQEVRGQELPTGAGLVSSPDHQGSWIASPRPYVVNDAVLSHRHRIYTTGAQGAVFWGELQDL